MKKEQFNEPHSQTRIFINVIEQMGLVDVSFWEEFMEKTPMLKGKEKIYKAMLVDFLDFHKKMIENAKIFNVLNSKN